MKVCVLAAMLLTAPAVAQELPCRPNLAALLAPAEFAQYPAAPLGAKRWARPDARQVEASGFRTHIRRGGSGPPNFAGRYKLVEIGCSPAVTCPAFVDLGTGRVHFPPALENVVAMTRFDGDASFDAINCRPDSCLIIVIGRVGEDRPSGVSYLVWEGNGLRQLARFIPEDRLCAGATA